MQVLSAAGFMNMHVYRTDPVVHGVLSAVCWIIWHVIRQLLVLYLTAETGVYARAYLDSKSDCHLAEAPKGALVPPGLFTGVLAPGGIDQISRYTAAVLTMYTLEI